MMQHGGGQGSEGRRPSSPRGGSSAGTNCNMINFSLLGQQLNTLGSTQRQHHQQNSQRNANPTSVNFSVGVPAFPQPFPMVQTNCDNGGTDAAGFVNMQNSLVAVGQNFNPSHQFMNQQMLQQQQQQTSQAPVALPLAPGPFSPESILNALNLIHESIVRLQAMVPFMAQNQQLPNLVVQQQAAAAISQIAQVAANMFPQHQPQPQQQQQQQQSHHQPQNMSFSQQPSISKPHPQYQQQQQQLSQIFEAPVAPAFNFFQDSGSAPGNTNSGGSNGMGNIFSALQGGGSRVNMDSGPTATSLAGQIAAIEGGVSGNISPNGGAGQGLGVPPKSSAPGGAQNYGGGQVGANHGASGATNMKSSMVVRSKKGSPRSNSQMGSGISRGGSDTGDMPHISHDNRSVNSSVRIASPVDDHDVGGARDEEDDGDGENLVPGSYDLVELEAIEILAEHTHFCEICGKGFKRDANLRMHMRGHGDEYKTPAALARPDRLAHEIAAVRPRRFSCPYVGCKRNKKHRKFQPLKTMLCVKNHYRRSHCPKILTCNKCKTKKFSVVADLKTHEKHCGCDKWQCSCGTTFSRKDKLFGHIGLFAGHTPAMPFNDGDGSGGLELSDMGEGPGPSSMSSPGNEASGDGPSGGGNLNAVDSSGMALCGGTGMGLCGNGLQSLSSRGDSPGCGGGGMGLSKDGSPLTPENSSSSDSFSSPGLTRTAMLQSLFSNKF